MLYQYSVVSVRKNLRSSPTEEPFAVILETSRHDGVYLVLIGRNPPPDGLSGVGQEMAHKSKEVLLAKIEGALKHRSADKSVLRLISEEHRGSFCISAPNTINRDSGKPDEPTEVFEEAFRLYAHHVMKTDFILQSFLHPGGSNPIPPFALPTPEFAEAIPVAV